MRLCVKHNTVYICLYPAYHFCLTQRREVLQRGFEFVFHSGGGRIRTSLPANCFYAYLFLSHAKTQSVAKRLRICVPLWRRTRTVRPYLSNGFQPLSFASKSNYWCPVNASSSMNINLFEWYTPHSLHDSPKRGFIH